MQGQQIFTIETAEAWFSIKASHERVIKNLERNLNLGYEGNDVTKPITEERIEFLNNRILHLKYLLSPKVLPIDTIVATLQHLNYKGHVTNYTIIKDETDVIISYQPIYESKW